MYKSFISILVFLLFINCASAQNKYEYIDSGLLGIKPVDTTSISDTYSDEIYDEEDNDSDSIPEDITGDTTIHFRKIQFPIDSVDAWKNKKEFAYAKNLDSLLRAKEKELTKDDSISIPQKETNSTSIFSAKSAQIILWTIAGVFVLFVLFKLFSNQGLFRIRNKNTNVIVENLADPEMIFNQNFDQLIHQSYKLGDFRMGVRYLFLKSLTVLNDRQFVKLSAEKTNARYLQEIPLQYRKDFSSLIKQYEFVFYGNFKIDADRFTNIESAFNSFIKKI